MRGGSIDNDLAASVWTGDHVGFQSCAASDRGDQDFFALPEIRFSHQVFRDGDAALVVDVGVRDECTVNLGFQELALHFCRSWRGLEGGPQGWTRNLERQRPFAVGGGPDGMQRAICPPESSDKLKIMMDFMENSVKIVETHSF